MTASTQSPASTTGSIGAGPKKTLLALRIIAVLVTVVAFAQPVLAGMFIGGTADVVFAHGMVGESVWFLALIQMVIAIVYVWRGRGKLLPLYLSIVILLAAYATSALGWIGAESRDLLAVHVPLAVVVIAAQLLFTHGLFRASAGEPRQ